MRNGQSFNTGSLIQLDEFGDNINQNVNYIIDDSQQNFNGLKKSNLLKNGFNRMERGYSEVNQSLQNYRKVLSSYASDLESFEKKGLLIIDSIYVPKTYSLDDVLIYNELKQEDLKKSDGKSVNEGMFVDKNHEVNILEHVSKENLGDILKSSTGEVFYDDSSNVVKRQFESIKNQSDESIKEYNDNYLIKNDLEMKNINSNQEIKPLEFDDNYSNNAKEKLMQMKNNQNNGVSKLEDNYLGIVKKDLDEQEKRDINEFES